MSESALKNKRRLLNKTKSIATDDPFGAIFLKQVTDGIAEADEEQDCETPAEIRA